MVLEAAVDRLGGAVAGSGPVEVGENVSGAAGECAAEGDQLGQCRRDTGCEFADDGGEGGFGGGAVGVAVGGDDALIEQPGGLHLDVSVVGERRAKALALFGGSS